MLEVLYDVETMEVRGWCGDESDFGNFNPNGNQAVVILDIDIPPESDWYKVDLENNIIVGNPDWKLPPPKMTSNPPSGKCSVTNLFFDPSINEVVVEYENTPAE